MIRHQNPDPGNPIVLADWLVVSLMRRSCHHPGADPHPPWNAPNPDAMLRAIGTAFDRAHAALSQAGAPGLALARPGARMLSRQERRLLRVLAALQQDDRGTADNLLFKLAPHPVARPVLLAAMERLAAILSASGLLVSGPVLGPAALPVLRRRGADPRAVAVDWPVPVSRRFPGGDGRFQPCFGSADDAE